MLTLPADVLAARLRDNARGIYAAEAAAELLIAHGHWLERSDFLAACVIDDTRRDGRLSAWINWHSVPAFIKHAACSSSEARILRLATEIAGINTGQALGDLLAGLDDRNAQLVLMAIGHVVTQGGGRR